MSEPAPELFEEALSLALSAQEEGEVPVGAIVWDKNALQVIGRGRNEILSRKDPTAHAELLAIRAACAHQNSERLNGCVLITTLEPCTLCAGAVVFSRIETVYYCAPVFTGLGIVRMFENFSGSFNHRPQIIQAPAYADRSALLLKSFFARKR